MTEGKENQKQAGSEVKTFSVPFAKEEINENVTITTSVSSKPSKKELINQSFKYHSQGRISEAAKYYQQFINQGFQDYRVFYNYALILGGLGKSHKAELLYRKAIQIKPDYAEAHCNLGVILRNVGKLHDAELSYRKAIDIKPDYANANYNLGNILKDLGQLHDAELSYRKAIHIKPDFAIAHCNLGIILNDLGKLKEAELSYRKAIEIKPDFAEAHFNLGNVLKDLGKPKDAEISYSKSIELNRDFTTAIMNRAILFFEEEEFDKALRDSDSLNSDDSRAFSLEILYALGRIEEIYKRIEKSSKLDDGNIRLAAFSSFISEQEKKDTSYNFCRNPLSFLYFSNIKFHCKDYVDFSRKIINDLSDIQTTWEPPKKATHNGFQTTTNINLFFHSSKNISRLKSIILNELEAYYSKYKNESCSFIQKWPSNKKFFAWHVILKKQGYQDAHIHPSGWLSGVIYLKVVPSLGKDEGAIEFSLNGPNYSNINSPQLIHHPEVGDIVFFPSSLHHRTIPFSTDTDRIVIAFDLMPN